jgi:hypothetical protein
MGLLKFSTCAKFSQQEFVDDIPPYAILSHTWGADGESAMRLLLKIWKTGLARASLVMLRFGSVENKPKEMVWNTFVTCSTCSVALTITFIHRVHSL